MKLKTLVVTVIILAAVSVAVFIAQRPGPPPAKDPRVGQPLLDRSTAEQAAKLRVSDQGKTVVLARKPDGTWQDASYFDLPADFQKLSSFVGNFTEAKVDRVVTSNPERIARLEFKDTKVELLDAADKPVWSVTLGKTPDNGSGRFLRFGNEAKAYEANVNAWIDPEAKSWAETELLNLKADDIAKVEIGFEPAGDHNPAPATVVVARPKQDANWTAEHVPAGQQLKADRVSSLINTLGTLRFTDTNDLKDTNVTAAREHERTIKLTTFDGKTYTVALGRKPEEKKLKPPAASTDGKTGPAALGSVADLTKDGKAGEKGPDANKPAAPEFETIPAGPVFVFISSSDAAAPVNALMRKRAFQIGDYIFTSLPQKPDELFEPAPKPEPAKTGGGDKPEPAKMGGGDKPAEEGKSAEAKPDSARPTPAKK